MASYVCYGLAAFCYYLQVLTFLYIYNSVKQFSNEHLIIAKIVRLVGALK